MSVSWRHMLAGAGMAVLAAGALTVISVSTAVADVQADVTSLPSGGGSSSGVASAAGAAFYKAAALADAQQ